MRLLIFGLIFLAPPFLKRRLLAWIYGARIGKHASIGWFSSLVGSRITLGAHSLVRPFTLIYLSGKLELGAYSEISSFNLIYGSSDLTIGEGSYIGPQCLINVEQPVLIGDESALGPRSMLFTHGSFLPYTEGYWSRLAGARLGNRVWCAAGVYIHPGVEIGDNTFVNSCAVVTASIPAGSVVEGNPARVVYPMQRVQRKMTPRAVDVALQRMLQAFAELGLRRELGLRAVHAGQGRINFSWRSQPYEITLVPSDGVLQPSSDDDRHVRRVFFNNCPGWQPPFPAMVFDLSTMRTRFVPDRIHTALRQFVLRYYGLRFRDIE